MESAANSVFMFACWSTGGTWSRMGVVSHRLLSVIVRKSWVKSVECTQDSSVSTPGFFTYDMVAGSPYSVSYDEHSFMINGYRTLFLSGSIHYPRSTVSMWDQQFEQAKAAGLNMVETYVFWNLHQPTNETYFFEGRADLRLWLEKAASYGLFVNFRIGPYVCAEWKYGGLPVWLNDIDGIEFRTNNDLWKEYMGNFTRYIVSEFRDFFADRGGPIVLAQIENEYHYHDPVDAGYIDWCGELVAELDVNVPWEMCHGFSANNTINACNGNDCADYADSHAEEFPGQPLMWTENEQWFTAWGQQYKDGVWESLPGSPGSRLPSDVAYSVARWFARMGVHHNYYMWAGGNNYGTGVDLIGSTFGDSVTTSYATAAPIHSDSLPNEPLYTHVSTLHGILKDYAYSLLNVQQGMHRLNISSSVTAFEFSAVAFLENAGSSAVGVDYRSHQFYVVPNSVVIVDIHTLDVVYNTSDVPDISLERSYTRAVKDDMKWEVYQEDIGMFQPRHVVTTTSPVEQLSLTEGRSDYMYYVTTVDVEACETRNGLCALSGNLTFVGTDSNAWLVFVDDKMIASVDTHIHEGAQNITYSVPNVSIPPGTHNITLLSVDLGISNHPIHLAKAYKGIVGDVRLGGKSLLDKKWVQHPYLEGEVLRHYNNQREPSDALRWTGNTANYTGVPLCWWRTEVEVEAVPGAVVMLKAAGLSRGMIWVNGENIGRYWVDMDTAQQTQLLYHIPDEWLHFRSTSGSQRLQTNTVGGDSHPHLNSIIIFDEKGVYDISQVELVYATHR